MRELVFAIIGAIALIAFGLFVTRAQADMRSETGWALPTATDDVASVRHDSGPG